MSQEKLTRIDGDEDLREALLPYCRLSFGEVWVDEVKGHRVGCLDATNEEHIKQLLGDNKPSLAIQDPPYNIVVGGHSSKNLGKVSLVEYVEFCRDWVGIIEKVSKDDMSMYVWLGTDQRDNFQPLPDFMIMMREFGSLKPKSYITMRNQRGYGTQKNWMTVRQELLYYVKGTPVFNIAAEYTDIPKILRGYYKNVDGKNTDNLERGKSPNIRAGNVWVDIQQVFYRMEENVPGCYTQKPLKSTDRIVRASSSDGDVVLDTFSHSGSALVSCELLKRVCCTCDMDPIFAEITIRRLERLRDYGKLGWQFENPFPEVDWM